MKPLNTRFRKEVKTLAKTVEPSTVKAYMQEYAFYSGAALDDKKRDIQRPDEIAFFMLSCDRLTLYIPIEVYRKCHVKPSVRPNVLFDWDDEAEAAALAA